jgi:hypothetical protein
MILRIYLVVDKSVVASVSSDAEQSGYAYWTSPGYWLFGDGAGDVIWLGVIKCWLLVFSHWRKLMALDGLSDKAHYNCNAANYGGRVTLVE